MSNSEDDSFAEELNTGSDSPNTEGNQAPTAPSYSEQQTEKIGIKADLRNIGTVSGQETPVESVSRRNRKGSCSKDSGGRCKDSKKRSEIKPGTSMRISEDKCSSHISDISRNIPCSSKIKTRLISDASTSATTGKSVYKQIASKYEVESTSPKKSESDVLRPTKCEVQRELHTTESKKPVEDSPTAQSLCVKQKFEKQNHPSLSQGEKPQNIQPNPMAIGREFASAKKADTSTNVTANEYRGSGNRRYSYPPGTYFAQPVRRKSVKILVEEFEDLILLAGSQKETERKQKRLGKSEDNERRISDIAAKSSMIKPEKVQSSSTPGTSFSFERSFISPENVQPSSRINVSNETNSPLSSTEKARCESKTRNSSSLKRCLNFEMYKTQPRSKASISHPNKMTSLTSPEKAQPRFRTSLPNESTQLSSPEKNKQSETKIIIPGERTSLSSPEKTQLSSRSQINLLNEKTLPKKQLENFAVQSDTGKAAVTASDAQPSILQEGVITAIHTLKHQKVLKSSSNKRQKEYKQTEFLECSSLERKDLTQFSLEFQEPIAIEHLRSNTEAETPKDSTERGKILRSRANTSGEISYPSSSIGPAESVFHENLLVVGSETTPVSHMQSSVVPEGSRSKVNTRVRSRKISRTYFEQQDTFEESLDSLDYITLRGMKKLDLILKEREKRCSEKYPRSDWVISTKDARETELVTLREMSRILITEFEETRKEKEESASHPSNKKSPEDGSGTAAVEQLQKLKSKSGSEQEKDSPDQQAGGELDKVDLSARPKSPRALFEILQAIKIDHRLEAWMELLRIFYRIGTIHTSNELKTVWRRMYDEKVIKKFFDHYLTHHPKTRRNSAKRGYFEENDLLFRRLRLITSRIGQMTMAMIWLDICDRIQKVLHDREQLREEKTTGQTVGLPPPLNIDSSNENRSESSIDSLQKESSKKPRTFSPQKLQEHFKIYGDEEPKQIDQLRGKVSGSKPTSKIVSSKESSFEKVTPQFYRVCKENLLLKELMRRKQTSSFREDGKVPAVDAVASPRIGSGGDLLSKCTQIKEKDPSGDTVSKHSDAQEVDSENNLKNLNRLPLDESDVRELQQIFDKIFGDMFSAFIQSNMDNF